MNARRSTRQWDVTLRYDAVNDCLMLSFRNCALESKEDVTQFFDQLYARARTFDLPCDLIVDYDGFHVATGITHFFIGARVQWSARIGGRIHRFARTEPAQRRLAEIARLNNDTSKTHSSYEAAIAQLRADRAAGSLWSFGQKAKTLKTSVAPRRPAT